MITEVTLEAIPHPKNRVPVLGDGLHIDAKHPTQSLMDIARGPTTWRACPLR